LFRPMDTRPYESHPAPARSYSDAIARVESLRQLEAEAVVPECRTQLLSHGGITRRVIVFVHGYTSCPAQFMQLAAPLHAEGHNILIVPMPLHGFPDRMSGDHAELTAQQLARYGDSVVDLARGLGEEITIAGLSAGGTVAGW